MATNRRASATLDLALGKSLKIRFKLMKVEVEPDAPEEVLLHEVCRTKPGTVQVCTHCGILVDEASTQNTGLAKGKRGTAPKVTVCTGCSGTEFLEVPDCPTCKVEPGSEEVHTYLKLGDQVVQLTKEQLSDLTASYPTAGTMQVLAVVPRNVVGKYLMDTCFQLIPEKGSTVAASVLGKALDSNPRGAIVRFLLKGNLHVGMIYVIWFDNNPYLMLHTLLSWDQVQMDRTLLAGPSGVGLEAIQGMQQVLVSYNATGLDKAYMLDPRREAFRQLHAAGVEAGQAKLAVFTPEPREDAAVLKQLAETLAAAEAEAKPKKATKKKAKPAKGGEMGDDV